MEEVSHLNIWVYVIRDVVDVVSLLFSESPRTTRSWSCYIFDSGGFALNCAFYCVYKPFGVDFMDLDRAIT